MGNGFYGERGFSRQKKRLMDAINDRMEKV